MTAPLVALPGFLGHSSDWDRLDIPDLMAYDPSILKSWTSLWEWGQQLNALFEFGLEQKILMGYSLGGRLALHALILNPSQWQAAIIISAHPGLQTESEKQRRRQEDQYWADRFQQESWQSLMEDWNRRDVFTDEVFQFVRDEKNYERWKIAKCLTQASLGCQDDLREAIGRLSIPILWVVGEKDKRYCHLAQSLNFQHPDSRVCIIEEAGHRVPWSQPMRFKKACQVFISR